jgi:SAM-dependent methyltransferase
LNVVALTGSIQMTKLAPILNVGCGQIRIPGSVGIDFDPKSCADVIHDLEQFPWPFPDQAFERVVCSHVVEHLRNPRRAMQEIQRIARPGALVEIATPHYSSQDSWGDLTHYMHLSLKSFEPFYQQGNSQQAFDLVSCHLSFGNGLPSLVGRGIAALFGLSFYEKYCCFVFRARNMEFVLRRH